MALKLGDKVWYLLGTYPVPEWCEAEVVDQDQDGFFIGEVWESNLVHLLVSVDRRRHDSSRERVLRKNISEGIMVGNYSLERPEDAKEVFEESSRRSAMEQEVRKAAAMATRDDTREAAEQAATSTRERDATGQFIVPEDKRRARPRSRRTKKE